MRDFLAELDQETRKALGIYPTKGKIAEYTIRFMEYYGVDFSRYTVLEPCAGLGGMIDPLPRRNPKTDPPIVLAEIHPGLIEILYEKYDDRLDVRLVEHPVNLVGQEAAETRKLYGGLPEPFLVLTNPPYGTGAFQFLDRTHVGKEHKHDLHKSITNHSGKINIFAVAVTQCALMGAAVIGVFTPPTWIYPERRTFNRFKDFILTRYQYRAGFMVRGGWHWEFNSDRMPVLFSLLVRKPEPSPPGDDVIEFWDATDDKILRLPVENGDHYDFGPTFRPATDDPHRAVKFDGTAPYIGSVPLSARLFLRSCHYWAGVGSVNLHSVASQHACVVSGTDAFEFNAICQSVFEYPATYHERHIHRPEP